MTGIYAIHNIYNDKYYIGQSKNIEHRWMQHRSRLKCQNHENKHLQNAYNKYGNNSFEYIIIELCNKEELDYKEKYYIKYYDSYYNGYNQDFGGGGCVGYKHSEEEILKMRMVQNPEPVLQIDSNLNIVNEWISCSQAGKTLGFSVRGIKACAKRINHQKTIGGYYWIFKNEYDSNNVDWEYYLNINIQTPKKVSMYDANMNLIKIYDSMSSVEEDGFLISCVVKVCKFKSVSHKGYIWRYTDEYTKEQFEKDKNTDFVKLINKMQYKISQYDTNGNKIKTFQTWKEIKSELGFDKSPISKCCKGITKTSYGYIWKFEN